MQKQHKLSSLNLQELSIFQSALLSASNGVCESVHTSAFQHLRSVFGSAPAQTLPSCLLPYFVVCYPERLITRLKGVFKGWSIFKRLCVCTAKCWWGMGRSAEQHDSGFDKHRLVRWNGCAPRWPSWVVCTQFSALGLNCWFCPLSPLSLGVLRVS